MASLKVGLDEILKDNAAYAASKGKRNFIPTLRLADGDRARIRFITDASDVVRSFVHSIKKTSQSGKEYTETLYCPKLSEQESCDLCKAGDINISRRMHMWLYVYEILHKFQNPAIKTNAEAEVWKKNQKGLYVEEVNKAVWWSTGEGKGQYILKALANYNTKYDTLLDREYEISRSGSGMQDTTYSITPESVSEYPDNIKAIKLPNLQEIVRGNIVSLVPLDTQQQKAETPSETKTSTAEKVFLKKKVMQRKNSFNHENLGLCNQFKP